MLGIYLSLAVLGLAAVDPVGIAIVLVLLAQEQPFVRSLTFLAGSFISLLVMGLLSAHGLGYLFLHFESPIQRWAQVVEFAVGLVLLGLAVWLGVFARKRHTQLVPSGEVRKRLTYSTAYLLLLGAVLVAVQSVLDVVFVIAMVRLGQARPSNLELSFAVTDYAFAALFLQLAVIGIVRFTPERQREKMRQSVYRFVAKYGMQTMGIVSMVLGLLLTLLSLRLWR